MKYVFRCDSCVSIKELKFVPLHAPHDDTCHPYPYKFEVEQRIMDKHVANCPVCGRPAQRVYTPITHYFNDCLYHMDGSKQDSSELPTVYGGMNKFFSGF